MMMDPATAYSKYKFIGYDFLLWLWFCIENEPETLARADESIDAVQLGGRMVLENPRLDRTERITAKGNSGDFDTARVSLQHGALVAEISLLLKKEGQEWRFTLKGESLSFSGIKTPAVAPVEAGEDAEAVLLEKAFLLEQGLGVLDDLFRRFIKLRIADAWPKIVSPAITHWVASFRP